MSKLDKNISTQKQTSTPKEHPKKKYEESKRFREFDLMMRTNRGIYLQSNS